MVERDDVDAALRQALQPFRSARRVLDKEAPPGQRPPDEAGEPGIVVDVEHARADDGATGGRIPRRLRLVGGARLGDHGVSGTCITEKNRPS